MRMKYYVGLIGFWEPVKYTDWLYMEQNTQEA